MKRDDLNYNEKRRFKRNCICPLCGKKITYDDNILYTSTKRGRCKKYIFYHERCLNGEEKKK